MYQDKPKVTDRYYVVKRKQNSDFVDVCGSLLKMSDGKMVVSIPAIGGWFEVMKNLPKSGSSGPRQNSFNPGQGSAPPVDECPF